VEAALIKAGRNFMVAGWAMSAEERDWKYRLSVYYSKPQDSGEFTCTTPIGTSNSITVNVKGQILKNVYCMICIDFRKRIFVC